MTAKRKVYSLWFVVNSLSCLIIVLLLTTYYLLPTSYADEIEDLQKQINELSKSRELSVNATKPLEGQLGALQRQLAQIQATLNYLSSNIALKQKELDAREEKIAMQQAMLENRVRGYYVRSFLTSPMLVIFSSDDPSKLFRDLSYRQSAAKEDRRIITSITKEVEDLLVQQDKLEKDKIKMASLQAEVDKNAQFIGGEVEKAKKYQAQLSSQIAQLSAKQQQIIASRQASLNLPTSLGAGPLFCTDDRKLDPGFRSAFAFFTYGIPHRVGMNQYGAYGRARAGQNYKDILNAYFTNINFEKRSNININVDGFGGMPLETYLLGIYEMPGDWPMDALKAQAVAARSYVLAYTNNGAGSICTTQACQVYKGGNKGGNWEQAVHATEGEVLTNGGQPIKAWFASTSGGYTFTSSDVWGGNAPWTKRVRDTNGDVSNFNDLLNKSYDKDSPCFYAAQGFRSEYSKSAWLKSEEVADIANVVMLTKRDSGLSEHLYQPDKPNPEGKQTWNHDQVKQELQNRGGSPFNSVSEVSMNWDFGSGMTTSVTISGDGRSETFNATEFRNFFNIRAPANIQIVGPLFNIERK